MRNPFRRKKVLVTALAGTAIITVPDQPPSVGADERRRRCIGHLSVPMRLVDVQNSVSGDEYAPAMDVQAELDTAVHEGLVVMIQGRSPGEMLGEIENRHDTPTIPPEKAKGVLERYETSWKDRLDGTDQFYLSNIGLGWLRG